MDRSVVAALVASMTAVVLAVWSLATARLKRSETLRAEEKAKRGELVRVRGLEVIDTLLEAIWDLIQMLRGLRGEIKYGDLTEAKVLQELETLTTRLTVVGRLRIKSAPYLTEELDAELD